MNKIRVLVVEDSLTVRKRLVEVLSADPDITVVGEAGDGKMAIELCLELHPDVVSLDVVLPVLSGLAVTEYVMAHCPTPILIVSASSNRGDLYNTYDALAAGAIEALEKPAADGWTESWETRLRSSIKLVSRIRAITHIRGSLHPPPVKLEGSEALKDGAYRLVAIGASTGGPRAAVEILRNLPADFPLPVLMVIHIGETFGSLLAEWLNRRSQLRVSCAVDGEPLPEVGQARVILATPGRHLEVSRGCLRLTSAAERHSCRPSVDVLFESIAREFGSQSIGCLLTGMGKDGSEGLLAIRRAGGRTLAQDEASSIVFGMPQEAIRIGAAERVVALDEVTPALVALVREGGGQRSLDPVNIADKESGGPGARGEGNARR